jgi:heavy metal sensor kinase
MIDQTPEGGITWYEMEELTEDERPWLQVWSVDGQRLYQNFEAQRRPLAEAADLARRPEDSMVAVAAPDAPVRVLTRRGRVGNKAVVIQVARSEAAMRDELQQLVLIFVLGLPVAVAVAGLGGYTLARRALQPVERMSERARSITAERLSDRLPVDNPDDEMGRLATVFNETLGRLERSFEQMRQFTADVSHELRTPLTSICGYAETLLTDRPDDATTRRFLETILSNGRRMQRLVDDLLDLSRIESGRWQPVPVALDPAAAAREVWASLGDRTGARPVEFAIDAAPDAPEMRADPDALRQILTNLLDNSLRHTPPGGTITCRIRREDGGIALSVRDTGTGIAREHLPRIFERFYRADASRSRDAGGTGLGLAIVKHLVEGHGGRVSAESERGAGTAVTCWFPA